MAGKSGGKICRCGRFLPVRVWAVFGAPIQKMQCRQVFKSCARFGTAFAS
jgi:hypothetical protein